MVIYVDSNDMNLVHEIKLFLSKTFDVKAFTNTLYVPSVEIHYDKAHELLT